MSARQQVYTPEATGLSTYLADALGEAAGDYDLDALGTRLVDALNEAMPEEHHARWSDHGVEVYAPAGLSTDTVTKSFRDAEASVDLYALLDEATPADDAPRRVEDMSDEQWGVRVWETCRDGGEWLEGPVGLRFQTDIGIGTGISRAQPAIVGRTIAVVRVRDRVGLWGEETRSWVESWAEAREMVNHARSRRALVAVDRAQTAVRHAESRLRDAKLDYSDAVRIALSEGASVPELMKRLHISRARVYQLRDGTR